jgi:hypothetical protein
LSASTKYITVGSAVLLLCSKAPVASGAGVLTASGKDDSPRVLHPPRLGLEDWRRAKEAVSFAGTGAELELFGEPEYLEESRP